MGRYRVQGLMIGVVPDIGIYQVQGLGFNGHRMFEKHVVETGLIQDGHSGAREYLGVVRSDPFSNTALQVLCSRNLSGNCLQRNSFAT